MHVSLRPTGADPGRILGAEDGREEALLLQGVLHWGHVHLVPEKGRVSYIYSSSSSYVDVLATIISSIVTSRL